MGQYIFNCDLTSYTGQLFIQDAKTFLAACCDNLKNITSSNMDLRTKALDQERIIAEYSKKYYKESTPNRIWLNKPFPGTHHDLIFGDFFLSYFTIYLDLKMSNEHIALISENSIEGFNSFDVDSNFRSPRYYYLCVNIETREALIVQHLYLYELIKTNKIKYQKYLESDKSASFFIGESRFNEILNNPELYDPAKIVKFKF